VTLREFFRRNESLFTPADVAELVRTDRGAQPAPLWVVELRWLSYGSTTDWIRYSEHAIKLAALDRAGVVAAMSGTVAVRVVRYDVAAIVVELPGKAASEVAS
jgi:hypothetical protein